MTFQSIDQVLPLLELLQQPAFCLNQDGTVHCNRAANALCPTSGAALPQWLGSSSEPYDAWDRSRDLVLPVLIGAHTFQVTLRPLTDGVLFLLADCGDLHTGFSSMSTVAQVFRQPLSELHEISQLLNEALEEMEDPILQSHTAAINRHIYRMSRIACNLADLELISSGSYPIHPTRLDLTAFLEELTIELCDICAICRKNR